MKFLCLALTIAAAAADGTVTCNVLTAQNPHCQGTCTTSGSVVRGQNFTITAEGSCDAEVDGATYHVDGKFAGLPVINHDCADACQDSDFAVGGVLNMGHMYIGGAACPVTTSQKLSIVSHAFVATSAPKGTLTTELVAKDTSAAKNILLDIQVIVTMD